MSDYTTEAEVSVQARQKRRRSLIVIGLVVLALFFAFCFVWFRASFPRYRYDQIMRLGWKVFIPITIGWIMVTAVAAYNNWFILGA